MVHFQTRYASWIAAVALPIGILVVGQERIREQHRSFAAEYSERELQIAMLRTENRGFTETVGGKTSMDEGTAGSSSGSESLGGRAELVSPGPDAYRLVAGMAEANKITIVSKDNLFVPQDNLRLRPEFADFFGLTDREFADIEREFAALANQGAILFRANSQLVSPAESEVAPGTGAERHSIQIAIDPPDSIAELRNRFEETVARPSSRPSRSGRRPSP